MKALDSKRLPCLVIGSGAGGLTTAITLARAGRRVIVLEEGSRKSESTPFSLNEVQSDYRNGGQVISCSPNPFTFGEGRVLGGGTSVNSGYYLKPNREKIDQFQRKWKLDDSFGKDLESDFSALEKEILPVDAPACDWLPEAAWARAANACGLSIETAKFSHRWNHLTRTLERRSLFDLWSKELIALGAQIIPDCRVQKIQKNGPCWQVEITEHEEKPRTIAVESIFLCAGAIQTPMLLRRSGLTINVGNNFHFHIFVRALARFPKEVNKERCPIFPWKAGNGKFTIGHSPDHPHLMALGAPELKDELRNGWAHWSSFYASVPTSTGKKIRAWGNSALIFSNLSSKERTDAEAAFHLLQNFITALGAERISPERFSARFLQSVHLFGSCPMGGDPKSSAVDSWGRLHEDKSLRIADASILGSSLGQNPQAVVMAVARRNARHFLVEKQ